MAKAPAIGIDLGTTNSCVAVFQNGKVEVIANDLGNYTTPSYVAFNETERLIGEAAKNLIAANPTSTIFDAKRLIGRKFDDPYFEEDLKTWPFVVRDVEGKPKIEAIYKGNVEQFFPEQISGMILGKLREAASIALQQEVTEAVITVPAYFDNLQREATIAAARFAKLKVLRIVNEPTAAAIAYKLDNSTAADQNVLVYDLGGGTFDVSVLSISEGCIDVKATDGCTHLGGDDFDIALVNYCIKQFNLEHNVEFGTDTDKHALRRLCTECEIAKRQLTTTPTTSIRIDYFHGGNHLSVTMTRALFEKLNKKSFEATLASVKKALEDCAMDKSDINQVILVGGSTRIPKVQEMLRNFFDGKELNKCVSADEAVARGAAILAAIVSGDESENLQNELLSDVTPLSLGIATKGDMMHVLIPRLTTIPARESQVFVTTKNEQSKVMVSVYQGERAMIKDNRLLGEFKLSGLRKAVSAFF